MKRQLRLSMLALFLVCCAGSVYAVADDAVPDFATGLKYFEALKKASLATNYDNKIDATIKGQKVTIVGCPVNAPADPLEPIPMRLAVKMCGQLVDRAGNPGPFINLQKHKWQRQERFYLWLETAVPLQLSIFQNYPDGRPASRQITPDPNFPSTFTTIMPGRPVRYPVLLEVDDDLRDELISIIAVRADAGVLPCNGARAQATATAQVVNGAAAAQAHVSSVVRVPLPNGEQAEIRTEAGAMAQTASQGIMKDVVLAENDAVLKGLNEVVAGRGPQSKDIGGQEKLGIVAENPAAEDSSDECPDVEILLLGPGNVAHIELTFHKD